MKGYGAMNASKGRVSSPVRKPMSECSRPKGRTGWIAGPMDAGVNARMATKAVFRDTVKK